MTNDETQLAVRNAMRDLATALIARDVARVGELLDDEFTGSDAAGVVVSKQQWLDDLAGGELRFESITADDLEMTPLAEAVRVRADLTFRAYYAKSNYNGSYRCLGLFAKHGDGWRLQISSARVLHPA